jgi:hypothetical protein
MPFVIIHSWNMTVVANTGVFQALPYGKISGDAFVDTCYILKCMPRMDETRAKSAVADNGDK